MTQTNAHSSFQVEFGEIEEAQKMVAKPFFNEKARHFLSRLSENLFLRSEGRLPPDVAAFAFWCRESNVGQLWREYRELPFRMGLGSVLHITPGNVPINFAFSWAFSLLAGNVNFVKLPSKQFDQISMIITALHQVTKNDMFKEFHSNNIFFRSDHSDSQLQSLQKNAKARVFWGSSETIKILRQGPCQPDAVDISFPSRSSIAAIGSKAFIDSYESKRLVVVRKFLQDSLTYGQRGCSSPRQVFWVGDSQDSCLARRIFWELARSESKSKKLLNASEKTERFANLCLASTDITSSFSFKKFPAEELVIIPNGSVDKGKIENFVNLGTFIEAEIEQLAQVLAYVTDDIQTVTYFGIKPEVLASYVVESGIAGIQRIVPFGAAFEMSPVWDGKNLLLNLSRAIEVR